MLYDGQYYSQVIDLCSNDEVKIIEKFLQQFSITFFDKPEYTIAFYDVVNDGVIATGSFAGEILRNLAVDCRWQGEGLMAEMVTQLLHELNRRGQNHVFIYTKPENKSQFLSLGFRFLGEALPCAILLEGGMGNIGEYCDDVSKQLALCAKGQRAGIVMNCNPFTLGHRYLIERAALENAQVIIFLLSGNQSEVPFAVRHRLLCEGVKDLSNVVVVESGRYIISSATFPDYFLKKEELAEAQTILDADVFARNIAKTLKITRRYVGKEPYCRTTALYNEALKKILPQYGIELIEIERKAEAGGDFISASLVRKYLSENNLTEFKKMVPQTTYQYFFSNPDIKNKK